MITIRIDIDYQYSIEDVLDDRSRMYHILCVLKIKFITEKQFAKKKGLEVAS